MDPFQKRQDSDSLHNYDRVGTSSIDLLEEEKSPNNGILMEYIFQQQMQIKNEENALRQQSINQLMIQSMEEDDRQRQIANFLTRRGLDAMQLPQPPQPINTVLRLPILARPTLSSERIPFASNDALSSSNLLQLQLVQQQNLQRRHMLQNRLRLQQLQHLEQQQLQEQRRRQQEFQRMSIRNSVPSIQRSTYLPPSVLSYSGLLSSDGMLSITGRANLIGTEHGSSNTELGKLLTRSINSEVEIVDDTTLHAKDVQSKHQSPNIKLIHSRTVSKKKAPPKDKSSDVGMPKRPLHAYNIFFQEERKRMLDEIPSPPQCEDDEREQKEKGIGGKKRRRRRVTHGKISFGSLAKSIGQKWQAFDDEQKMHYEKLAALDLQRYHNEMEEYYTKMIHKDGLTSTAIESNPTDISKRYKTEKE